MTDRLLAETLASRAGLSATDPLPQIAAIALMGLWRVYAAGLARCLASGHSPSQVRELVTADARPTAEIIKAALEALDT
jgi:hypothetical protein